MGYVDYLHTKSQFIEENVSDLPLIKKQNEDIILHRIQLQIDKLKDKEQKLYQKFGCNDEKSFYDFVHNFINNNQKDFELLNNFTASNLSTVIDKLKSEMPQNNLSQDKEATIIIQLDEKHSDKNTLDQIMKSYGFTLVEGGIKIVTSLNTIKLKDIVNKLRGTHFQTKGNYKDSTKLLYSYLEQNVLNGIDVYLGDETKEINRVTFKTSFLQYNSEELYAMWGYDLSKNQLNQKDSLILSLYNKIENLVMNLCNGGTVRLQEAARQVWNQKLRQQGQFELIDFFTGGKNWEKTLKGAFGEFQTAVFFQYLAISYPHLNLAGEITKLIGNQKNQYNQYFHTDVKFLEMLGIQVKNFSSSMGIDFLTGKPAERTVTVALHPSEIARIVSDTEVVTYITNSFFNRTFGEEKGGIEHSKEYIKSFFENYASELLNLDMDIQGINVPDQVSFYMIGGRFVPGSAILDAAFFAQDNTKQINIKQSSLSGTKGSTDEGYNLDTHGKHLPPARLTDWWYGTPYREESWTPLKSNSLQAWDKNISIKTSFTYSAFWENERYILFK